VIGKDVFGSARRMNGLHESAPTAFARMRLKKALVANSLGVRTMRKSFLRLVVAQQLPNQGHLYRNPDTGPSFGGNSPCPNYQARDLGIPLS
jgi:hypothetical protein